MIRASVLLGNDSRTVERPGPGKAPTAFRIWAAGDNPTDKGLHRFTRASAEALMGAQATRANLYSIDVDHLSLSETAPPEARKSVGWMRLATRLDEAGEPECWAVGVEWTAAVKAGLECDPPEWRYFSPAYDADKKTGEIKRFLNTALTNNPATWAVTALATAKENPMTIEELLAELQKLADAGEEKAKKALAALATPEAPASTTDVAAAEEPKAEGEEPKKAAADAKEEPAAVAASASILATVQQLAAKVAKLETVNEDTERASLIKSRPDLAPEVVTILASKGTPMSVVREAVKTIKRAPAVLAAAAQPDVKATRGVTQTNGVVSQLTPAEAAELDRRMGIAPRKAGVVDNGTSQVFATMKPADAHASIEAKKAAQAGKDGAK